MMTRVAGSRIYRFRECDASATSRRLSATRYSSALKVCLNFRGERAGHVRANGRAAGNLAVLCRAAPWCASERVCLLFPSSRRAAPVFRIPRIRRRPAQRPQVWTSSPNCLRPRAAVTAAATRRRDSSQSAQRGKPCRGEPSPAPFPSTPASPTLFRVGNRLSCPH